VVGDTPADILSRRRANVAAAAPLRPAHVSARRSSACDPLGGAPLWGTVPLFRRIISFSGKDMETMLDHAAGLPELMLDIDDSEHLTLVLAAWQARGIQDVAALKSQKRRVGLEAAHRIIRLSRPEN
jgi:hypothetical protein